MHARRSVLSLADEELSVESKFMLNKAVLKEVYGLLSSLKKEEKNK